MWQHVSNKTGASQRPQAIAQLETLLEGTPLLSFARYEAAIPGSTTKLLIK